MSILLSNRSNVNSRWCCLFFSTNIIKKKVNANLILTSCGQVGLCYFQCLQKVPGFSINCSQMPGRLIFPQLCQVFFHILPAPFSFVFFMELLLNNLRASGLIFHVSVFLCHYFLVICAISFATIPLFSPFSDFYFFIISKFWFFLPMNHKIFNVFSSDHKDNRYFKVILYLHSYSRVLIFLFIKI